MEFIIFYPPIPDSPRLLLPIPIRFHVYLFFFFVTHWRNKMNNKINPVAVLSLHGA